MGWQNVEDKSDVYLRWRIKKSYARIELPLDGKKRLLKAAYEETHKSSSQYNHLNTMIETEEYQDNHVYLAWVVMSRFHFTFLSTIMMR
jgi:hypothetical protein